MKALIIYTHPTKKSLNGAFLERVKAGLEENIKIAEIEVLDLYEEGFNPSLVFNEDIKRRDMFRDPLFEKYRVQLKNSDLLVFIYPIWWGRPPAMLLGYFDQVMTSGFAYKQDPGKVMPIGLLKGKKVICISTMKGPTGYMQLLLGNAHQRLMRTGLFNFIGIKKVKFFEFGGMESKSGKQEKKLDLIEGFMSKIS